MSYEGTLEEEKINSPRQSTVLNDDLHNWLNEQTTPPSNIVLVLLHIIWEDKAGLYRAAVWVALSQLYAGEKKLMG